jgi:hypothetical protein
MLADQFAAAAAAARNTYAVDEIARLTWRAHAEGQLAEAEATAIREARVLEIVRRDDAIAAEFAKWGRAADSSEAFSCPPPCLPGCAGATRSASGREPDVASLRR